MPLEKERVRLLLSGLATHHAGLLPVYKALIEELFNDNLVKVCSCVYARPCHQSLWDSPSLHASIDGAVPINQSMESLTNARPHPS